MSLKDSDTVWQGLHYPIIGLAPMDSVTDLPFRIITSKYGKPDLIYTEFVAAEGLAAGALRLLDDLKYLPDQKPIIAQFFGIKPEAFYLATVLAGLAGFDGVDINMGCPAKDVASRGAGAGLIRNPDLAKQIIIQSIQGIKDFSNGIKLKELPLPSKFLEAFQQIWPEPMCRSNLGLSVKTRIGTIGDETETWIPFLAQCGVGQITLHGRTLKQGYAGLADWEVIGKAKHLIQDSGVIVFGNGDIQSRSDGLEHCTKYRLDGVLIGRNAIGNPWCFKDYIPSLEERISVALEHAKLHSTLKPEAAFGMMRKHLFDYTKGFPGAKHVRLQLNEIRSLADIERILSDKRILSELE